MIRIGCGFDIHPLVAGRRLILGGIDIPHPTGLQGHSDADALTHAICDALLGAAAMPDIGQQFPDTAPQWKDASSLHLLQKIGERIRTTGAEIINIDATIALQAPKISPHTEAMRKALATALQITTTQISVKATTGENLGFIGRQEGIAIFAVALLQTKATN